MFSKYNRTLLHRCTYINQVLFFYPKIPTIKASFDVAVIQRNSRFGGMTFLKDKREERRTGRGKKEEIKGERRGREKTEKSENGPKYMSFREMRVACAFLVVPHYPQRKGLCHSGGRVLDSN